MRASDMRGTLTGRPRIATTNASRRHPVARAFFRRRYAPERSAVTRGAYREPRWGSGRGVRVPTSETVRQVRSQRAPMQRIRASQRRFPTFDAAPVAPCGRAAPGARARALPCGAPPGPEHRQSRTLWILNRPLRSATERRSCSTSRSRRGRSSRRARVRRAARSCGTRRSCRCARSVRTATRARRIRPRRPTFRCGAAARGASTRRSIRVRSRGGSPGTRATGRLGTRGREGSTRTASRGPSGGAAGTRCVRVRRGSSLRRGIRLQHFTGAAMPSPVHDGQRLGIRRRRCPAGRGLRRGREADRLRRGRCGGGADDAGRRRGERHEEERRGEARPKRGEPDARAHEPNDTPTEYEATAGAVAGHFLRALEQLLFRVREVLRREPHAPRVEHRHARARIERRRGLRVHVGEREHGERAQPFPDRVHHHRDVQAPPAAVCSPRSRGSPPGPAAGALRCRASRSRAAA